VPCYGIVLVETAVALGGCNEAGGVLGSVGTGDAYLCESPSVEVQAMAPLICLGGMVHDILGNEDSRELVRWEAEWMVAQELDDTQDWGFEGCLKARWSLEEQDFVVRARGCAAGFAWGICVEYHHVVRAAMFLLVLLVHE